MSRRNEKATRKSVLPLGICLFVLCSLSSASASWTLSDSLGLIAKMESAYERVKDYRTYLVITGFGNDESFRGTQKLFYTFKKPNKIRIDFESPHRGMTIIYPDKKGKVFIRPYHWASFIHFRLDPKNSLLEISPGQQINETDLGLLIRNISHSLTDMFIDDLNVSSDGKYVVVRVLSDNPFRRGVPTRYVFYIDARLWLPVKVEESTAGGVLQRTVVYDDLSLNTGVRDGFFDLD